MKIKYIIHRLQDDELEHWDETKHPRGKGGRFISTGGSVEVSKTPKTSTGSGTVSRSEVAASVATASGNILRGVQNISNEASKIPVEKGETKRGSYPNMTNQELQTRINRLQLEQRYSDLKGDTKYVKSGGEKTREVLQTIGAVAGIGASIAVAIGAILPHIKKRGG